MPFTRTNLARFLTGIFTSGGNMNSATQKQAIIAGARTFLQTFRASLLVIVGGGGILGTVTDIRDVPWEAAGAALAAGVVMAFFAGLDAYLDFTVRGIPATYASK